MEEILKYIEDNNLKARHRYRKYSYKRFYLYNLLRNEGFTLYDIAAMFNRDHVSVIYGIKTHKDLISVKDKLYLDHIDELIMMFESTPKSYSLVTDVINCYSLERLKKIKFRIKNNMYKDISL
jgi:hypothetical protein